MFARNRQNISMAIFVVTYRLPVLAFDQLNMSVQIPINVIWPVRSFDDETNTDLDFTQCIGGPVTKIHPGEFA
jgi:hypothetical protein